MNAYNNHEDVILSPDDIWMVVCLNFTKYVNNNSEELRSLFVNHEGKKKLTVVEPIGKDENDWTDFFGRMKEEINKNVNGDIVNVLSSTFTTTGMVEGILSHACIMDTFKEYFKYGRRIPCCGIRNVAMMGSLDDWVNLKNKAIRLKEFCNKSDITEFVDNLLPIFEEFINTYQEAPNVEFWNKIMNIYSGRLGSGSTRKISGWILNFFMGLGENENLGKLSLGNIKVEVEVENHCTGQQKLCYIIGGFVGVSINNGQHRPVMSLGVVEDLQTIRRL